ncbi:MAG TPA: hypothetical protein VF529_03260 [Solirubrobacteraceae bacterium]
MDGGTVLERLRERPAGERLLGALDGLSGVHLVGGAVRDLLVGREPRDLDLVVLRDGVAVAVELALRLGVPPPVVHGRFGTAALDAGVNVATARAESYARPGALPDVRAGSLEDDLARRDFTVNAIAVGVSDDVRGAVSAAPRAFDDLEARRLRVLHDRSFVDDPTRLVRLARYAARLGFEVEKGTAALAREAFVSGAPATAGAARMGNELLLALHEPDPVATLATLRDLAAGAPLEPGLEVDEALLRRVSALLAADPLADESRPRAVDESRPRAAAPALALLAALVRRLPRDEVRRWLADIHLREAPAVLDAVDDPEGLAAAMRAAERPSELWRLLRRRSPQAVALAGALGAEKQARRWLADLRHVRLAIGGEDLLRAGIAQGPEVGRRLDAALARKLDEGLGTREEELAAALEVRA